MKKFMLLAPLAIAAPLIAAPLVAAPALAETTVIKKTDEFGNKKVIVKRDRDYGDRDFGERRRNVVVKKYSSDPEYTGSVRVKKKVIVNDDDDM